jgi:hypothetical protein
MKRWPYCFLAFALAATEAAVFVPQSHRPTSFFARSRVRR